MKHTCDILKKHHFWPNKGVKHDHFKFTEKVKHLCENLCLHGLEPAKRRTL